MLLSIPNTLAPSLKSANLPKSFMLMMLVVSLSLSLILLISYYTLDQVFITFYPLSLIIDLLCSETSHLIFMLIHASLSGHCSSLHSISFVPYLPSPKILSNSTRHTPALYLFLEDITNTFITIYFISDQYFSWVIGCLNLQRLIENSFVIYKWRFLRVLKRWRA